MRDRSANVEQERHAQANNSAAPESSLTPKEVFENCRTRGEKPHGFSKLVAEHRLDKGKIGDKAASILRYLAHKQRTGGKNYGGKIRVRINLDHIAAQYAYMGRSTADEAIARLVKAGACEISNWNTADGRQSYDRTRWFHVPKNWSDLAEKEIRYYYPSLAAALGIPAASIHYNFMYWIDERARTGNELSVILAPSDLAKRFPYSVDTIGRKIERLEHGGLFVSMPGAGGRCLYGLMAPSASAEKSDEGAAKSDKGAANPDEIAAEADNNSYCKNFVECLKESSKTTPQAASANFPFVEEANPTLVDQDIASAASRTTAKLISPFEQVISCSRPAFPPVKDFDELHALNHRYDSLAKECEAVPGGKDQVVGIVHDLCQRFLRTVDEAMLDKVFEQGSNDEAFDLITPRFVDWYQKNYRSNDSGFAPVIYYGALECVISALLRSRHGDKLLHPITMFRRVSYGIYLHFWSRAESRREEAIKDEFAQRKEEFQSIDILKEHDDSLPPAEKTRTFKQGLYSLNKVGWLRLGGELAIGEMVISTSALKQIERFFERNEHLTPAFLLDVMRDCLKIHEKTPPPPPQYRKNCRWHARMAHHLSVFAKYLPAIFRQLKRSSEGVVFLNEHESEVEELEVAA